VIAQITKVQTAIGADDDPERLGNLRHVARATISGKPSRPVANERVHLSLHMPIPHQCWAAVAMPCAHIDPK
jgi:hypothetical protein